MNGLRCLSNCGGSHAVPSWCWVSCAMLYTVPLIFSPCVGMLRPKSRPVFKFLSADRSHLLAFTLAGDKKAHLVGRILFRPRSQLSNFINSNISNFGARAIQALASHSSPTDNLHNFRVLQLAYEFLIFTYLIATFVKFICLICLKTLMGLRESCPQLSPAIRRLSVFFLSRSLCFCSRVLWSVCSAP